MMSSPEHLFDIYMCFLKNTSHQLYLGIGIGSISTNLSENVGEMDGEAFHRAFDALEQAKKENIWIKFKSGWGIDEVVTCLLNFMVDVMWSWTKRQKEIVIRYKKVKGDESGITLEGMAEDVGIKKQTISKILKRSKHKMVENAERALVDFISQI